MSNKKVEISVENTFLPIGSVVMLKGATTPLVIIGFVAYKGLKINYFKVVGLLIGAMTGAPALGYAESLSSNNDQASVTYATVYPLTMFLRVMAGQLLVLFFCS